MDPRRTSGLTITGTGVASTPVDRVTIHLAVEIIRPDAGEAFRLAGDSVTRLLAVLADDGVDSRQVRTLDLSLGPRTEWTDNREVLIGYQAHQRIVLRLDGLAGVERILTDVARGGQGVRIESVTLTAEAAEQAEEQARERAFADAWNKAVHYARLAAKTLGDVEWVHEGREQGGGAAAAKQMWRASAVAAADMAVAGGDTDVTAWVTVRWNFAD